MKTTNLILAIFTITFLISCGDKKTKETVENTDQTVEQITETQSEETETQPKDEVVEEKTNDEDLPVIKAIGEQGENIDWKEIEKAALLEDSEGPGYFYSDCAQGVNIIKTSSELAKQGTSSYGKDKLSDDNPNTAWVEGKDDYGIGEYFITKGYCPNVIYNGYQNSPTNWKNNSRVKRFKIYVNNKPTSYLDLTDEMGVQRFDGPSGALNGTDEFKFEIVEVYKGEKFSDVAISHIDYAACCFALDTEILSFNAPVEQETIKEGAKISTIDVVTGKISEASIQKISTAKHVNVVNLFTKNHKIKVTKNHPLFFEGFGFISLEQLQKKLKLEGYTATSGFPRVLTVNKVTKELEYEMITRLIELSEVIETYTVSKISNNSNYIANGFVCKPY